LIRTILLQHATEHVIERAGSDAEGSR
jgi:hypothetical protein